jgi:hypothetical protein
MFSFARMGISFGFWLGGWAVKAERSELILSLDGPTAQPWQGFPGQGRHGYSPFASFRQFPGNGFLKTC